MRKKQPLPISVEQAAELIGCTRRNVLYLIQQGLIQAQRIGRKRTSPFAVDVASVEAYARLPYRTGRKRKGFQC